MFFRERGVVEVEAGFTSANVCRIVGISRRQVQYWDEIGLVKPSARAAAGRGTRRLYSFADLVELSVVRLLIDRGLSPEGIGRVLDRVRGVDPGDLDGQKLITDGNGLVLLTRDSRRILEVLDRQAAFSLALGPLVHCLREATGRSAEGEERQVGT